MRFDFIKIAAYCFLGGWLLLSLVWLSSCSDAKLAQYHYKKATAHGYVCYDTTETITIERVDSFPVITKGDTVWKYFVTKSDTVIRYKTQYDPKTRYQIKTEYKLKRDSIEVVKYRTKIEYKQNKSFPWVGLLIVICIGAILIFVSKKIKI